MGLERALRYKKSAVTTRGNHSFIALDAVGPVRGPDVLYPVYLCRSDEILEILEKFEKGHPNLEVLSWHFESVPQGYHQMTNIRGIWITHRNREASGRCPDCGRGGRR